MKIKRNKEDEELKRIYGRYLSINEKYQIRGKLSKEIKVKEE